MLLQEAQKRPTECRTIKQYEPQLALIRTMRHDLVFKLSWRLVYG